MKHMAVVGTGSIGLMLGGFLAKAGHDVTLVSQFRPQTARELAERGITVSFNGETWTTPVRALYYADIPADEQFDILFLTGKSNDTDDALEKMLPHLRADGFVTSLQNGINDDRIAELAGAERVMPCVCFAGGQVPEPCHVVTHDGYFILGEPSGQRTERLAELADILSCAKRVELTDNIRGARWKKLSEVCLTVPTATVSGIPLFGGYADWRVQRLFGRLAVEVMQVERACGVEPEPILHLTEEQWAVLAERNDETIEAAFLVTNRMPPPAPKAGDNAPKLATTDAYTADIRRGRPLEVWFTNGYVAKLGNEHGVDVSTNTKLLAAIRAIEDGTATAGISLLESLLA
jgi:2-dehydropantoate 2-reductase